jgi:hypothetical protein
MGSRNALGRPRLSARQPDPVAERAGLLDGATYRRLNMEQEAIHERQAPITVKGATASAVLAVPLRAQRLDAAADALSLVTAPTPLLAASEDVDAMALNQRAQEDESRLEIVPRTGCRFERPGARERVATLTRDWFVRHLRDARLPSRRDELAQMSVTAISASAAQPAGGRG